VHTVTSAYCCYYYYYYYYCYYHFYKSLREPACERAPFERGRDHHHQTASERLLPSSFQNLRPVRISSQLRAANQRTPGLAASTTRESGLAP